jgi:hypothetical protein
LNYYINTRSLREDAKKLGGGVGLHSTRFSFGCPW